MELMIAGAGAGLSAYAALQEGKDAAEQAKIEQKQLNQQADSTREAGSYAAREKRKEANRITAMQIAQIGAQGGQLTGSKLNILTKTAKEMEMDARVIQLNADNQATQLRNQGAYIRYQGQQARKASRIRALAGGISTFAGLYALQGGKLGGSPGLSSENKATLLKY